NADGWNRTDVDVTFTCADTGSGVVTCAPVVHLATEGAGQPVSGEAKDAAGNVATVTTTISIDKTAPSIAAVPSVTGWTKEDVTVTFTCADALSGVAECPDAVVVSSGGTRTIAGTAIDKAGNTSTTSALVTIDRTPPSIVATPDRAPNAAGWNRQPVTVTFQCADTGSGIAACTDPRVIDSDGAAQVVSGTATDKSGNSASTSLTVSLDRVAPSLSINSPADGAIVSIAAL